MSHIGKALDALFNMQTTTDKPLPPNMPSSCQSTSSGSSTGSGDSHTEDVTEAINSKGLSGVTLVYALMLAEGTLERANTLVSPRDFFAYIGNDGMLHVVGGEPSDMRIHPIASNDISTIVLSKAQELGATFNIHRGEVLCKINDVSVYGSTYAEAAMRALKAVNQAAL